MKRGGLNSIVLSTLNTSVRYPIGLPRDCLTWRSILPSASRTYIVKKGLPCIWLRTQTDRWDDDTKSTAQADVRRG